MKPYGSHNARCPGKIKFCARRWRAEIPEILEILNSDSFAGCWDKFCVISTPRACLDSNATFTQSRASVTPYDLRSARFPEKKIKFCALGAPKFREFCNSFLGFFAQILQFCNISTPDAFLFGSKRNFDLIKSFISVFTRFCASQAGRVHDFFLRKARRNSGDLPKLA